MKKKILITCKLPKKTIKILNEFFKVKVQTFTNLDDLKNEIKDTNIIIIRSETKINKNFLNIAKNLEFIGRVGAGLDNVNIKEAEKKGIKIVNTPNANSISVAELVFGLLLNLIRNIRDADITMKKNLWEKTKYTGLELNKKKFGIIGLGKIGKLVANIAKSFGMEIYAYDPFLTEKEMKKLEINKIKSINDLIQKIDFLSIHVPKNKNTENLINKKILKLAKRNLIIINCARGGIINEIDLYNALKTKQILGAGIDTWENEPNPLKKLKTLPNVIALPHLGASTFEAQERCIFDLINNLFNYYGYKK